MTWTVWIPLLLACLVISLTPGAGAINTMTNSLTQGWRRSLWGIIGQQAALVVHIGIVAAGVGLVVSRSPLLFTTIRWAGAAYLVYLGIRMLMQRGGAVSRSAGTAGSAERGWSMARRGFWVNLLNPKAIVFFLAFVPQFIRLDQAALPQYLVLGATVVLVDVAVMWFFFAAAARPLRRLTTTDRGARLLDRVFGSLFLAVAGLLAFAS
ncbi:LysE family transporter [Brachybacterium hainanense]|uniref:LysE family transporter n=1 Tax=Brachybacterium hainanense TaxID=1541174 RepID=A0ABV6R8W4_9MICO